MGLLQTASKLFWDKNVNPITTSVYNETNYRRWSVNDFQIVNDQAAWLSSPFELREDVIMGLLISNTIKQSFGAVLLPILGIALPLHDMATKAMISTIEGWLNGGHAQLISSMVSDLNSNIAVDKVMKTLLENKALEKILTISETIYAGMYGWTAASAEGIEHPQFNTFNELHYSIWQSASLAILMLGIADTVSTSTVFHLVESGYELPNMSSALRQMAKDTSIMTTYLTTAADESFRVLPEDFQQAGKKWLQALISDNIIDEWKSSLDSLLRKRNQKLADDYFTYNINKGLINLRFYPKETLKGMPEIIEKHLLVDIEKWFEKGKEEADKKARRIWW